jgi:DNA-binding response OmpR family regulator
MLHRQSGIAETYMALFSRTRRAIRRLLVVEDEPLIAFDNEHALESAGYEIVATVDRGDAAIALLEPDKVDAIVLDVNLAGDVDGIAVAKAAGHRGIAVLFVTGSCPGSAREHAWGCLAKPYLPGELVASLAVIDRLMQGEAAGEKPGALTLFRGELEAG